MKTVCTTPIQGEWTGMHMHEQWRLHCASHGAVDTTEWACVLHGCRIQNDWVDNESTSNFALSLIITTWEVLGWFRRLLEMMQWVQPPQKCGTNASKMVKNLLKVIHSLEGLQQAEHLRMLMYMGCNQQRSDSVRTRSWSGDSQTYCVWDFDEGSWHEMCCGKIHSAASAIRAEGTLCYSCYWLRENCVRSSGAYFEGDWGGGVLCSMFLVSSSINVFIFHIT